jgi:G6PDH family F420-dependent oxidoreductase
MDRRKERIMTRIGYKLMSEEHGPRSLVENAVRAEELGFDFVGISDHYAPWVSEQGHSPFAWSVLGAIAQATERVGLMTGVTCPYRRYHPAIVAQAAATVALLSDGRFTLGLGSGELLNEHVTGELWPRVAVRHEYLSEALDIIRQLFAGGEQSYSGRYLELANAELYDRPKTPPLVLVAAGGEEAARLAGEKADGLIAVEADRELVAAYHDAGGSGPLYAEIGVCWARTERKALETLHRYSRWSVMGWGVLSELPRPKSFEEASESVKPQDLEETPHGPDPDSYARKVEEFIEAGFDHLILSQAGPDQDGFFEFYERELGPVLESKMERESEVARSR